MLDAGRAPSTPPEVTPMPSRAQQLLELGQSVWLDFIRRGHLLSGEFDRDVRDAGVVGVTSNPTIFQQAIAGSDDYDAALTAGIARGLEGRAAVRGGGDRGHPARVRQAQAGVRALERARRAREPRGEPAARERHDRDHRLRKTSPRCRGS
jgi:hypothetical protein